MVREIPLCMRSERSSHTIDIIIDVCYGLLASSWVTIFLIERRIEGCTHLLFTQFIGNINHNYGQYNILKYM